MMEILKNITLGIVCLFGLILLAGASLTLSTYINSSLREKCEANGGHFIENRYHSKRSLCDYGR